MVGKADRIRINELRGGSAAVFPDRSRLRRVIIEFDEQSLEVRLEVDQTGRPVRADRRLAGTASHVFHCHRTGAKLRCRDQLTRRFEVLVTDPRTRILWSGRWGRRDQWNSERLAGILVRRIGHSVESNMHAVYAGAIGSDVDIGPGVTTQTTDVDIATNGTGVYCVHVALNTVPDPTDKYAGKAFAVPLIATPPPAAPQDPGPRIGYENFEAPGQLVPASQLSSGAVTVEYMGRGAGEPSVGANWATGLINFQSDLQTLFVKFNDDPAQARAIWENRRAPTSQFIDSDPIGFTDHTSSTANRVFAGELTLLSPDTVKISHTDDDGMTWVADQSGGLASAVDHETIGGGPYAAPLTGGTAYPHAIYYCSQDIATALCSRSDDGGSTYGPSIPIYSLTDCAGLHGHVKVAPDGTVYVPNRACNSPIGPQSAVVVSTDNGTTWSVRQIKNAGFPFSGATDDPAVSIDAKGRVYCLFAYSGTSAAVGVSADQGKTWP